MYPMKSAADIRSPSFAAAFATAMILTGLKGLSEGAA